MARSKKNRAYLLDGSVFLKIIKAIDVYITQNKEYFPNVDNYLEYTIDKVEAIHESIKVKQKLADEDLNLKRQQLDACKRCPDVDCTPYQLEVNEARRILSIIIEKERLLNDLLSRAKSRKYDYTEKKDRFYGHLNKLDQKKRTLKKLDAIFTDYLKTKIRK
jgi:hypothetical protein